jgi:hypothetical protein
MKKTGATKANSIAAEPLVLRASGRVKGRNLLRRLAVTLASSAPAYAARARHAEEDGAGMLKEGLKAGPPRLRLYTLFTFINRNRVTSR